MRDFKTWKREVAGSLALWLMLLASYTAYVGTDEIRLSVLGLFTIPILGMLAAMLGLDAIQKQDLKKLQLTQGMKEDADAESDRIVRADTDAATGGK